MEDYGTGGLTLVLRTNGYSELVTATHDAITHVGGTYASVECTLANAMREVGKADLVIFVGKAGDEAIAVLEEIWKNTGSPIFFVVEGDPARRLEKFPGLVIFSAADEPFDSLEGRVREELTVTPAIEGLAPQSRLPDVLVNLTTNEAFVLAAQNIPLRYRTWFLAENCQGEPVLWMGATLEIVADVTVGLDEGKRRIFVAELLVQAVPSHMLQRPALLPTEFEILVS